MKKYIRAFFSTIIRVFYTIKKTGIPSINNTRADILIWSPEFFTLRYFYDDNFIKTFATYHFFKKEGISVSIYNRKKIGKLKDKKIIFFGGKQYNNYSFTNYSNSLIFISENLEEQGNIVFPNSNEASIWENKLKMHQLFDNLTINSPKTESVYIKKSQINYFENLQYPVLVKEENSCSALGLYKLNSFEEAKNLFQNTQFIKNNNAVLIQELLNIRRDLRVILVGKSIVHFYWRINKSKEWKPTSTGQGSEVDFITFPEQWREWIVEQFQKLNITTGAFDIAWQNDDLSNIPLILEVSPFYQPNPIPKLNQNLINYGKWKKSVSLKDSYQIAMVDIIFRIQEFFVEEFINKHLIIN
jgi:glutathione synthase/RimK-type ligase-like ATP-grasp enzyme